MRKYNRAVYRPLTAMFLTITYTLNRRMQKFTHIFAHVFHTCATRILKKWLQLLHRIRRMLGSDLKTNYPEFFVVLLGFSRLMLE
jgi:hypothetical protein